jgi:hypothetical protein
VLICHFGTSNRGGLFNKIDKKRISGLFMVPDWHHKERQVFRFDIAFCDFKLFDMPFWHIKRLLSLLLKSYAATYLFTYGYFGKGCHFSTPSYLIDGCAAHCGGMGWCVVLRQRPNLKDGSACCSLQQ